MKFNLFVSNVITTLALLSLSVIADDSKLEIKSPNELVSMLKEGGLIVYMRHGPTERKGMKRDIASVDFSNCESQRNLSAKGQNEMQRIGNKISKLNLPIGNVYSSPYCRTKETAEAVFGKFEIDPNLAFSFKKEPTESARLGQYLKQSMENSHDAKNNTVFVGHTANLKDGLGIWPKPEGVAVIFKNTGDKVIFLGMIKPTDWPNKSLH